HAYVPSFGDWGFVAAGKHELAIKPQPLAITTRFLDADTIADLLSFPKDATPKKPVEVSTLDRPRVHDYYMAGWQYWHGNRSMPAATPPAGPPVQTTTASQLSAHAGPDHPPSRACTDSRLAGIEHHPAG